MVVTSTCLTSVCSSGICQLIHYEDKTIVAQRRFENQITSLAFDHEGSALCVGLSNVNLHTIVIAPSWLYKFLLLCTYFRGLCNFLVQTRFLKLMNLRK